MPVTIKSAQLNYKDAYDNYVSVDAIAEKTTSEMVADIESTGARYLNDIETSGEQYSEDIENSATQYLEDIEAKGAETRASIPSEYTELSDEVTELKSAIADLDSIKISFPVSPDSKYGTNGQLLRTKGNGATEWVDEGLPTDAQTANAISSWLNDHPEATTTVQDRSLTIGKFSNLLIKSVLVVYQTLSELEADETIFPGMFVITLGENEVNDGKGNCYKILESEGDAGTCIYLQGSNCYACVINRSDNDLFDSLHGVFSNSISITKSIKNADITLHGCSLSVDAENVDIIDSVIRYDGTNQDVLKINKSHVSVKNVRFICLDTTQYSHSLIKVGSDLNGVWGVSIENCTFDKSSIHIWLYAGAWITSINILNNTFVGYRNYGVFYDDSTGHGVTHTNIKSNIFERINTDYLHGKPIAIGLTGFGHTIDSNILFDDDSNAPMDAQSTFITYSDSVFETAMENGAYNTALYWMRHFADVNIVNNTVEGAFDLGLYRNMFRYDGNFVINHQGNTSGLYEGTEQRNEFIKNGSIRFVDLKKLSSLTSSSDLEIIHRNSNCLSVKNNGNEAIRTNIQFTLDSELYSDMISGNKPIILFVIDNKQNISTDVFYLYNTTYGNMIDTTMVNFDSYSHIKLGILDTTKLSSGVFFNTYKTIQPSETYTIRAAGIIWGLQNELYTLREIANTHKEALHGSSEVIVIKNVTIGSNGEATLIPSEEQPNNALVLNAWCSSNNNTIVNVYRNTDGSWRIKCFNVVTGEKIANNTNLTIQYIRL